MDERRRLLLVGDVEGGLAKLYSQVETQQKKVGAFNALFAVGAFLPALGDSESGAVLAEFVSGTRKVPIETFFIDSRSAAFLQAAPEGKQLCEKIHFLGGLGVRELHGLRVAYLSGCYDGATYAKPAEEGGACFVGSAYTATAVKRLIKLAQAEEAPIDVLLTAEWPRGMEERVEEAERPKDPDGHEIDWAKISSPAVAELCVALEPRYHIFGGADLFYQRAPFQTKDAGHVCRCIALGKVASKGKARTAFHGLSLSPAAAMPETALKQRPANTTPNPFAAPVVAGGGADGEGDEKGTKRDAAAMEEEDPIEPDTVFLGRLPPNIEEKRIQAAFKHVGKIERVHLAREAGEGTACKGFGWVTFSTPEEAEAAVEMDGMLECGGRMITISISRPKARADGGPRKKKREIQIVVEPHADCWFCLVNPKVEKHMIVTATTEVYIATARGPVNPYHVQILPVKHAPCFAACPPDLQQALQVQLVALRKMFADAGQECLVWERWIPMGMSSANHMQVQVLPIDKSRCGSEARGALEAAAKQHLAGATFKKVSAHTDVVDNLNDDPTTPYIYFEIPGDLSARGRVTERFLYAALPGKPRIPINFGRQVACHLLGCEDKVDWRQCQDSKEGEKKLAVTLRELFKPFQVKGKPKSK